jgi:hypothetical protein
MVASFAGVIVANAEPPVLVEVPVMVLVPVEVNDAVPDTLMLGEAVTLMVLVPDMPAACAHPPEGEYSATNAPPPAAENSVRLPVGVYPNNPAPGSATPIELEPDELIVLTPVELTVPLPETLIEFDPDTWMPIGASPKIIAWLCTPPGAPSTVGLVP